jgi:putative sigma-54 modulation protein
MEIIVTGRHLEITDAIKKFATDKVSKLPRYYDRVQRISVIAAKKDRAYDVELIVDVEHHEDFVTHVSGDDLYAIIDLAVDKAERQLTDFKERTRNRKHPDGARH